MSDGQRTPLAEAKQIAQEVLVMLSAYCVTIFPNDGPEIMIAGSIRREKDTVGDVEFAVLQSPALWKELDRLVTAKIITQADYGSGSTRWGEKYRGFMYRGMKCEVWAYDETNRGIIQWLRTGPGDANTQVMVILGNKRAPYRLQEGHLYYAKKWQRDQRDGWVTEDRELIPIWSEQQLFSLLGIRYLEPSERTEERYVKAFAHSDHYFGFKPHVCHLWTDQVNNKRTRDSALIDATAMTASTDEGKLLAPTWDILKPYQDGLITWDEYAEKYLNQLRERFPAHRLLFESMLKQPKLIVGCYCQKEKCQHCHRTLAKDVLKKIAWKSGLYVVDEGEVKEDIVQQRMFG